MGKVCFALWYRWNEIRGNNMQHAKFCSLLLGVGVVFVWVFFIFFFILLFYHLVLLCSQLWQTSWRFCQGNGCRFPWKRDLRRVLKRLLITAGGERPRGREKVRLGNTELNINSIKFAYETRNYWTFSLISTASCLVKKSQAFHQMDEFHPRN